MTTRTTTTADPDGVERFCDLMESHGAVHVSSVMLAGRIVDARYLMGEEIWEVRIGEEADAIGALFDG